VKKYQGGGKSEYGRAVTQVVKELYSSSWGTKEASSREEGTGWKNGVVWEKGRVDQGKSKTESRVKGPINPLAWLSVVGIPTK